MITVATKLSRAATVAAQTAGIGLISPGPPLISPTSLPPLHLRSFCKNTGTSFNPVTLQMINYALSHARSQKSDESYAQVYWFLSSASLLSLTEIPRELSYSPFLPCSLKGNYSEAIHRLHEIQDLSLSSMGVKEALVGLHLELGQDGAASVLADVCAQLLDTMTLEIGGGCGFEVPEARRKAIKGLVELVRGNLESAEAFFQVAQDGKRCAEACNMASEEVLLAATCALGQVEVPLGNFGDAEEILTRALTRTEQHFGSHHPKIVVVLTSLALMFPHKAMMGH